MQRLKEEYKSLYLKMHRAMRLTASEEDKKSRLLLDPRHRALHQLRTMDLFPTSTFEAWQKRIESLKACDQLIREKLEHQVICPFCHLRPVSETVPKDSLSYLEEELDRLLGQWTSLLIQNLEFSEVDRNIDFLPPVQQDMVKTFLSRRKLDLPVDHRFLQAVKTLLKGIEQIKIPVEQVVEMLGSGSPWKPSELRKHLEQFIYARVGSRPESKVRIMLVKGEE